MHAMRSRVPFPARPGTIPADVSPYLTAEKDRQSDDPSLVRLAAEITRGSIYMHESANAILSWIADNLTFDTSITVASDAVSALRSKKAFCVGYSNLAVALLRAAGIPARVAHGYLPPGYEWGFSKDYWGVKVNDGGYHAYIEIFYPDTGWVFSDAEHSHNFVDPFHIILRIDGVRMPGAVKGGFLDVDKATFYTIFREVNNTVMVDELPVPREKRLGRRLGDRQHAAVVSGRVLDAAGTPVPKGSVVLWKDGRGTPSSFADGRYSAVVTTPGKYRIELRGAGFRKSSQEIQIEQGITYPRDFTLHPGGVIKGRVRDSAGRPLQDGDVFYREGSTSFGVPINNDGTYRIEGLTPGQYRISVTQGDKDFFKTGDVMAGKETVLDFVLK
ncbi:MAG: hypothetical protein A2078_09155 [Nitrospirae bacterium GWC2_57_9]|nr:MAG: hypothetical protein A2078_09155 [Nitrospirae bacterium GWC2_57_9]